MITYHGLLSLLRAHRYGGPLSNYWNYEQNNSFPTELGKHAHGLIQGKTGSVLATDIASNHPGWTEMDTPIGWRLYETATLGNATRITSVSPATAQLSYFGSSPRIEDFERNAPFSIDGWFSTSSGADYPLDDLDYFGAARSILFHTAVFSPAILGIKDDAIWFGEVGGFAGWELTLSTTLGGWTPVSCIQTPRQPDSP